MNKILKARREREKKLTKAQLEEKFQKERSELMKAATILAKQQSQLLEIMAVMMQKLEPLIEKQLDASFRD